MIKGISHYQQLDIETEVHGADPHRLIQMLFEGALKHIAAAKGAMQRGTASQTSTHVKKATTIIAGLEEALDKGQGGEMAENFERVYQHAHDSLILALSEKSVDRLDQVTSLLLELKSGWDQIAPGAR